MVFGKVRSNTWETIMNLMKIKTAIIKLTAFLLNNIITLLMIMTGLFIVSAITLVFPPAGIILIPVVIYLLLKTLKKGLRKTTKL